MSIILFLSAQGTLPLLILSSNLPHFQIPNQNHAYPTFRIHTDTARYIYFILPLPSFPSMKLNISFPSFSLYSSTKLTHKIPNNLSSCQNNFILHSVHSVPITLFCTLTFKSLAITLCTTRFNIQKFYITLALRWVFCTDIRTDSDFCFIHH